MILKLTLLIVVLWSILYSHKIRRLGVFRRGLNKSLAKSCFVAVEIKMRGRVLAAGGGEGGGRGAETDSTASSCRLFAAC